MSRIQGGYESHSDPWAYSPSRFEAQTDAVSLIFSAKTQANPESSVGLMSMGGKGPEVLVTLTTDFGKILDGLHRTKIKGTTHLATGIQIAWVSSLCLPSWPSYDILEVSAHTKGPHIVGFEASTK